MWVTSLSETIVKPNAIALGNFDGIHRGHLEVLRPILNKQNPTLVSFQPHPREFFTGEKRKLLTPAPEKREILEELGVEQLIWLPFNQELAELTPRHFVERILVNKLEASVISVGEDFRFGYQRKGDARELEAIAAKFGITVEIIKKKKYEGLRISSSLIRQALEEGKISQANQMLGRRYTIKGKVVTGQKLGSTIGFPTANLEIVAEKFLPKLGVYCVRVFLEEGKNYLGVMNHGCRPTVDGKNTTIEVHLLDWEGDLYCQTITIALEQFLRPEQKFPSLEALKAQISADCQTAIKINFSQSY